MCNKFQASKNMINEIKFVISYAENNDLIEVAELYEMFWGDVSHVDKMKRKLSLWENDNRHHLLVAKADGKIIGTIFGVICEELYGECKPFLVMEDLIVKKEFRRAGVARALLLHIESIGREHDCSQIQFITESNRKDAISFYETMGYNSKFNIGFKKKL